MIEKQKILEKLMPIAVLKAMTPAAELAVSQSLMIDSYVSIYNFPFRVGRESRVKIVDDRVERIERVKSTKSPANNELYLIDNGRLLNISREHFQIEKSGEKFYLYDRGSACGTIVGDQAVSGKNRDATIELKDGDTIVIGTKQSPYVFQFILLDQFEVWEKE